MQRLAIVGCLLAVCLIGAAEAQTKFPSFTAALNQPDYSRLKDVIGILGTLSTTFSNPSLKVTVFVPNNAAFAAAEKKTGISMDVLKRQKSLLQQVVYYHIVKQVVKAPLPNAQLPTFVANRFLTGAGMVVKGAGSSQAKIVQPNVVCGQGIAHGIDNVLTFINIGH